MAALIGRRGLPCGHCGELAVVRYFAGGERAARHAVRLDRTGTGCYMVGKIPLLARATMVLTEFPWLIVLVVAIFCFLMAMVIWAMVRRRARARLQGSD